MISLILGNVLAKYTQKMIREFYIVVLLLFNLFVIVLSWTYIKDATSSNCTLNDGSRGQCTTFFNCRQSYNDLINNIEPTKCGFAEYNIPLVCCSIGFKSENKCRRWYHVKFAEGGRDAGINEIMHMAALGFGDKGNIIWGCGGSLISDKFVLTAAHCLYSRDLGEVKFVRLGDVNLKHSYYNSKPQNFTVTRRIRHPQYKASSKYHDIGIIKLNRPAITYDNVKPACLKFFGNELKSFTASGWGHLKYGGLPADHLQVVDLIEVDFQECSKYYSPNRRLARGIVKDWQICARGQSQDTCQGDSGGPLQFTNWPYLGHTLVGITSFGKPCGLTRAPGVYTRVSYYIEWIESIIHSKITDVECSCK